MKLIISTFTAIVICATAATAAEKAKPADKAAGEDPAKKAFKQLDTNRDGFISLAEWRMSRMTDPAKTDAAFKALDKNGDGKLSYDEFKAGSGGGGAGGAAEKPKFTKQQVDRRLKELKDLLDKGLITQGFYERKVEECQTNVEK